MHNKKNNALFCSTERSNIWKRFGFLSFAKNMVQNIVKNISKDLSGKYSSSMLAKLQKFLDHAKEFGTDALKSLQKTNSRNSTSNW